MEWSTVLAKLPDAVPALVGALIGGFIGVMGKPGQSILYTSAEIPDCIPHRGGGALYAVCTSSKSHNCWAGKGNRAGRMSALGR